MAIDFLSDKSPVDKPPVDGFPDIESQSAESWDARKMARIDKPITKSISGSRVINGAADDTTSDSGISVAKQMEMEADNAIKYRTCSWKKTAALLFSEYICLAIMSFPYSYATLGLVPGLILTVVVAGLVLYTSLIVW